MCCPYRSSAVVGNKIIFFGGGGTQNSRDVVVLDIDLRIRQQLDSLIARRRLGDDQQVELAVKATLTTPSVFIPQATRAATSLPAARCSGAMTMVNTRL